MSSVLKRLAGETPEDYQYRISMNKELLGTWQDVADHLNRELGWNYGECKYRKDFVATQRMCGIVRQQLEIDEEAVARMEDTQLELYKERQRLADQRREFNKAARLEARFEHLCDMLRASAKELADIRPLLPRAKDCLAVGDSEAVIAFSDWHYGMVCDNLFNTYDTDTCRQRVAEIVGKAAERLRLHRCKKLHVLLLGDAAHGAIHTGARVASEELVCNQIMQVAELIAEAIGLLANEVGTTFVYSTYGNHLRTVQSKADSIHEDNMERLVEWWLAERLARRSDVVVCPSEHYEFIVVKVCGCNLIATHGDLDKIKTMGVTMNTLFSKAYNLKVDYTLSADKHHVEEFEGFGIESSIAPALCGADDYANGHRLYSQPAQKLMVFTPADGKDAVYNLRASAGVKLAGRSAA